MTNINSLLEELRAGRPGPPVGLRLLADLVGVSVSTMRREVAFGVLVAHRSSAHTGRRAEYRVDRQEARRYLHDLGVLRHEHHEPHEHLRASTTS